MSVQSRDCPSGKRGYASKSAAKRDVRLLQTRGAPISRVYRCSLGDCRQYHLTAQERLAPR